ncbi:hypothetical protein B5E41_30580 [Rhizobium esperanzae]|uniref:Uncharacterized protein n=1 Tax=Rhizobium esperanzae TaxID=1967781 RepID=A0A2D0AAE9_9HYPH|nr:hypothetical protein B5E41_30580 [Rhizobium esperanzae]
MEEMTSKQDRHVNSRGFQVLLALVTLERGKMIARINDIRTRRPDRFLLIPGIYNLPAVLIRRMVGLQ